MGNLQEEGAERWSVIPAPAAGLVSHQIAILSTLDCASSLSLTLGSHTCWPSALSEGLTWIFILIFFFFFWASDHCALLTLEGVCVGKALSQEGLCLSLHLGWLPGTELLECSVPSECFAFQSSGVSLFQLSRWFILTMWLMVIWSGSGECSGVRWFERLRFL